MEKHLHEWIGNAFEFTIWIIDSHMSNHVSLSEDEKDNSNKHNEWEDLHHNIGANLHDETHSNKDSGVVCELV